MLLCLWQLISTKYYYYYTYKIVNGINKNKRLYKTICFKPIMVTATAGVCTTCMA